MNHYIFKLATSSHHIVLSAEPMCWNLNITYIGADWSRDSSGSLETLEQSLCDAVDSTEGGAVWKRLHEVFTLLYTAAEQRIQGHGTWNGEKCNVDGLCSLEPVIRSSLCHTWCGMIYSCPHTDIKCSQVTSWFPIINSESLVSAQGHWLIKYCETLPKRQLWRIVVSYAAPSDTAALPLPQGKSWINCIITPEIDLHVKTGSHSDHTVMRSIHLTENYWWNMYHCPVMCLLRWGECGPTILAAWQWCKMPPKSWMVAEEWCAFAVSCDTLWLQDNITCNPVSSISPRNTDPVSLASSSPPPFENILLHSWKKISVKNVRMSTKNCLC